MQSGPKKLCGRDHVLTINSSDFRKKNLKWSLLEDLGNWVILCYIDSVNLSLWIVHGLVRGRNSKPDKEKILFIHPLGGPSIKW